MGSEFSETYWLLGSGGRVGYIWQSQIYPTLPPLPTNGAGEKIRGGSAAAPSDFLPRPVGRRFYVTVLYALSHKNAGHLK